MPWIEQILRISQQAAQKIRVICGIRGCLAAILLIVAAPWLAAPQNKPAGDRPAYRIGPPDKAWVEKTLKKLPLREKIGQLIQIRVSGRFFNRQSEEFKALKEQVRQCRPGGVVLFSGNVYESAILLNELQGASKLPLLVAADFERGASFRISDTTSFPWTMALGAAGSEELAYRQGVITAQEARAMGVHWIFAPVMDVNNNPENPVINIRAFGEDPQLVSRLGAAFIRGARSAGVLTTAKHFPGHGDTSADSHIGLPIVESNLERLQALELMPFRGAIEAGVDSIMTAHIAVPQITGKREMPATLSSAILTGLLRDALKFNGIVVTDALEMGGISNRYWCGLAAVGAIQAGADVLLLPPDATVAINSIERAVKRGDVPIDRIDKSVRRVLQAKSSLGLQTYRTVSIARIGDFVASPQNRKLAQEIADRSITVIRDHRRLLPVNPLRDPKIFSLILTPDFETSPGSIFQAELRRRFPSTQTAWGNAQFSSELSASIEKAASRSDLIVLSTLVRLSSGREDMVIPEAQQVLVQKLVALDKPLIWIALGNPYVLRAAPRAGTYLCTFSYSDVSQTAAAKALAGEISVSGKMPVSIPGWSEIGDGMQIPRLDMTLKPKPAEGTRYSAEALDKIRQVLISHAKAGLFPGAGLVVGHRGSVALEYAFGRGERPPSSDEVRPDTIYDISSLSNAVGLLSAAMLAADAGSLLLDAPASDYLPEIYGLDEEVRVRDLLKGISNDGESISKKRGPDSALLKEIVVRAAGLPFERFLAARLFNPLGMKTASFVAHARLRKRGDSQSLYCTIRDLAVFSQMLLNRGVYDHKRYFSPDTFARFAGILSQSMHATGRPKSAESHWTGRLFSSSAFGYGDPSGSLLWIEPERELFIVLLIAGERSDPDKDKIAAFQELLLQSILDAIAAD